LGTDKKVTAKDIKLTPGPGHYNRVDEQFPRTFHHATQHGSQISPIFATLPTGGQNSIIMEEDDNNLDLATAKRNSVLMRQSHTGVFFGSPGGAEGFDAIMQGFSSTRKMV